MIVCWERKECDLRQSPRGRDAGFRWSRRTFDVCMRGAHPDPVCARRTCGLSERMEHMLPGHRDLQSECEDLSSTTAESARARRDVFRFVASVNLRGMADVENARQIGRWISRLDIDDCPPRSKRSLVARLFERAFNRDSMTMSRTKLSHCLSNRDVPCLSTKRAHLLASAKTVDARESAESISGQTRPLNAHSTLS